MQSLTLDDWRWIFLSLVKSNNIRKKRERGHTSLFNPKTHPNFANPTNKGGGSATIIRGTNIVWSFFVYEMMGAFGN